MLSSRDHFFSNGAPNDIDNNGPEQCGPNFLMRCAKNCPIRYNTQDITTVSNKMLLPSEAAQSILAPNRTYSNEFTIKISDKGVFRRFLTHMAGFNPTFPIFVSVKPQIKITKCACQVDRNYFYGSERVQIH